MRVDRFTLGLVGLVLAFSVLAQEASLHGQDGEPAILPLDWRMSPLLADCNGPVDGAGRLWSDPDFDDATWQAVGLPHTVNRAALGDRFYRTTFSLASVPTAELFFRSDDGLRLFVNGVGVGEWGRGCHQPGCVNGIGCGTNTVVPPVDITSQLRPGRNVLAAHVSNGPQRMSFTAELTVTQLPPSPCLVLTFDPRARANCEFLVVALREADDRPIGAWGVQVSGLSGTGLQGVEIAEAFLTTLGEILRAFGFRLGLVGPSGVQICRPTGQPFRLYLGCLPGDSCHGEFELTPTGMPITVCNLEVTSSTSPCPQADPDQDGSCTPEDNCPQEWNPRQQDHDADGIGDACDPTDDCLPPCICRHVKFDPLCAATCDLLTFELRNENGDLFPNASRTLGDLRGQLGLDIAEELCRAFREDPPEGFRIGLVPSGCNLCRLDGTPFHIFLRYEQDRLPQEQEITIGRVTAACGLRTWPQPPSCDDLGQGGDADGDGVCSVIDNCPSAFNPAQGDSDMDGNGDVCDPNLAPEFRRPTDTRTGTALCGTVFEWATGKELELALEVVDPDPTDVATLRAVASPPTATLTPGLPVSGNPVSSTFHWTPTDRDVGRHEFIFEAADPHGHSTRCVITLDVLADGDGDGLPDAWESSGYTYQGRFVDLPAMSANPRHKDIFVELDYMVAADHTHRPHDRALEIVTSAFASVPNSLFAIPNPDGRDGITLHVNLDDAFPLPHLDDLGLTSTKGVYDWSQFDAIKRVNFAPELSLSHHYCVFAHNGPRSPTCPPQECKDDPGGADRCPNSGISRGIPSSDFLVCLGSWTGGGTVDEQAGTFMHELGHNLGLCHGGPATAALADGQCDTNHKPNYLSVMNYRFQFSGIPQTVGMRLRYRFDYSRFDSAAISELREDTLLENSGLVDPAAPGGLANYWTTWYCENACRPDPPCCVDNHPWVRLSERMNWNCNDRFEEDPVQSDINKSGVNADVLTTYNDWRHLQFAGGSIGGGTTPSGLPLETIVQELTRHDAEAMAPVVVFFLRGDVTTDGKLQITDPVRLLGYLFLGSPTQIECLDAGDWDDDGDLKITDAIANLGFQFLGSPPAPAPGPLDCGPDPTPDGLRCASFVPCTE